MFYDAAKLGCVSTLKVRSSDIFIPKSFTLSFRDMMMFVFGFLNYTTRQISANSNTGKTERRKCRSYKTFTKVKTEDLTFICVSEINL